MFDNVKDRVKAISKQTRNKDVNLDYTYITPTLIGKIFLVLIFNCKFLIDPKICNSIGEI